MRVLHVITRLILGGAQENTLLTVLGQQRDPRFKVSLLVGLDEGGEGDTLIDVARAQAVDLRVLPSLVRPIRPFTDLRAFWGLYRSMRRERYDIVHTHSSKAGILARLAARAAGVPIIVHTLHSLVFHEHQSSLTNHLYIVMKRLCAPLTDALISVNRKTLEGALAAGIGRPEQHEVILSGMDLRPFLSIGDRMTVAEAKERLGLPPDAPVVGKIARLFPLKGHDLFLQAAERIARRCPSVRFLLVGGGPLREALEADARRLGLAERTHFVGLVAPEEVPAHIQAMDVVVHTSLREGIARVLPQAGAVGKPVVTFDMDGAPEVVRDAVSGYLTGAGDLDLLADRVVQLLEHPALRAAMGAQGRRVAEQGFGVDQMVSSINALYLRLLRQKAGLVAAYQGQSA